MRKITLFILTIFLFFTSNAQNNNNIPRHKILNISLGGLASSFQDKKTSTEHYSGFGTKMNINYTWSKKSYWEAGTNILFSWEHAKTYNVGNAAIKDFNIYLTYLYPVINSGKHKLLIGLNGDFGFFLRTTQDLGNNATYMILGSDFKFNGKYIHPVSEKWTFNAAVGLQLFGWIYEGMSFTYSTSQEILEQGKYDYNVENLMLNFVPLWKYFTLTTEFQFDYSKRWGFGYRWHMEQSYQVKHYTMTMGYSELYVNFKIINRFTNKKQKNK